MAETTYYQSRHTGEEIDNLLDESIAATEAANAAAKNANDESAKIPGMVAGKADLDPNTGYVNGSQMDPRYGLQTGVIVSNGYYNSLDPKLLFEGNRSLEMTLSISYIPSTLTTIFRDNASDNPGMGLFMDQSGYFTAYIAGMSITIDKSIDINKPYYFIFSLDRDNKKGTL